jgi:hypothetical protein
MQMIENASFVSAGDMESDKIKAEQKTKAKGMRTGNNMGSFDPDQIERVEMLKISTFDPT